VNTTFWAILGAIGTAIVSTVAIRLVAQAFEWRSRLIVSVTVHQSFRMPSVYEEVLKLRPKSSSFDDDYEKYWEITARLRSILNAQNYVRFELKNNSNKKLSALTFCAHSVGDAFLQIGDGELAAIKADIPAPLGELQPKREIVVHLLSGNLWGAFSPADIKKSMVFSADELGSVTYKFPLPLYQKMRMRGWGSSFGYFIGPVLMVIAIVLLVIKQLS
jgi:hypothetical protein